MDEVDDLPVDRGSEVREAVQAGFEGAPVELPPFLDEGA